MCACPIYILKFKGVDEVHDWTKGIADLETFRIRSDRKSHPTRACIGLLGGPDALFPVNHRQRREATLWASGPLPHTLWSTLSHEKIFSFARVRSQPAPAACIHAAIERPLCIDAGT